MRRGAEDRRRQDRGRSSPTSSCCSSPIAISPAIPMPCWRNTASAARIIGCCISSTANPGLRVANLLEILKITKQSFARVLKQLIDEGFIMQRAGAEDRRERRLYVTAKGARLADKLTTLQVQRVETALQRAGVEAESATRRFLLAMISEADRPQVEALVRVAQSQAYGSRLRWDHEFGGGSTRRTSRRRCTARAHRRRRSQNPRPPGALSSFAGVSRDDGSGRRDGARLACAGSRSMSCCSTS